MDACRGLQVSRANNLGTLVVLPSHHTPNFKNAVVAAYCQGQASHANPLKRTHQITCFRMMSLSIIFTAKSSCRAWCLPIRTTENVPRPIIFPNSYVCANNAPVPTSVISDATDSIAVVSGGRTESDNALGGSNDVENDDISALDS